MIEDKNLLQQLDDEYGQLGRIRAHFDEEVTLLCGDNEANASPADKRRINELRQRYDEANSRREHIENFAMVCSPQSRDDVYILLRLSVALALDYRGDRFVTFQRNTLLPRMIAEAAAFLLREEPPNRELFIGVDCRTWNSDVSTA